MGVSATVQVLTKTGSGTDATFLEGIDYAVTRAAANKAKRVRPAKTY